MKNAQTEEAQAETEELHALQNLLTNTLNSFIDGLNENQVSDLMTVLALQNKISRMHLGPLM